MIAPARVRALALLLAFTVASLCRADDTELWYRVLISDAPSGWMRVIESDSDGRVISRSEMLLKIKRGPINMEISMNGEFVETSDGKPVSMSLHQKLGSTPVDSRYTFRPDGIDVESTQAGQTMNTKRPLPSGQWFCPAAGSRELRARVAKGEKEIVLNTIDPMSGVDVLTITHRVVGPDTIMVGGKAVKVTKATVETSIMPGVKSTEYFDEQGVPLRTDTLMGGLKMSMVKAGPEVMTEAGPAPELMVSTFVKPDRPIENPRETRSATYLLSIPDGEIPALPVTGTQTPEALGAARVRLNITAEAVVPAPTADAVDEAFLASTAAANLEDPSIKKLLTRALKEAPEGKAERAEKLRRFVYKFISKKGLDVGMATASEVARTKAGDCSEHGVLLAALLRADGIPSRVAAGVIYADAFAGAEGIFGYHMWSQALLEKDGVKRWVDLDATLPDSCPYDATHITLGLSDLSDKGGMQSLAGLVAVLGKLKIEVESVK